jgi:hypothetical protein
MLLGGCASAPPPVPSNRAPLPDGFKSEETSSVPGLYAHGIYSEDDYDRQRSERAAIDACAAQRRNLEYVGDPEERSGTQYWLYRSGDDTVLFVKEVRVVINIDLCRVTINEKRRVKRSVEKAGAWPSPFRVRRKCSVLSNNCYTATRFGIRERCRAEGNGFHVSRECMSSERGPSRGLLLESGSESDDMSGYGLSVTDLQTNVLLDEALFERSRTW